MLCSSFAAALTTEESKSLALFRRNVAPSYLWGQDGVITIPQVDMIGPWKLAASGVWTDAGEFRGEDLLDSKYSFIFCPNPNMEFGYTRKELIFTDDMKRSPVHADIYNMKLKIFDFKKDYLPNGSDPDLVVVDPEVSILDSAVTRSGIALVADLDTDGDIDADDIDAASGVTTPTRNQMIQKVFKTLSGDADLNGTVQMADFIALAMKYNQSGGWADGDSDGNGTVEMADFIDLAMNYNKQSWLYGGTEAVSVPEPTSLALLALGGVAMLRRRRR